MPRLTKEREKEIRDHWEKMKVQNGFPGFMGYSELLEEIDALSEEIVKLRGQCYNKDAEVIRYKFKEEVANDLIALLTEERNSYKKEIDVLRADLKEAKKQWRAWTKRANCAEDSIYKLQRNLKIAKGAISSAALAIDWNQQCSSRYYIGEDGAGSLLSNLGFDWSEGLNNESVEKHIAKIMDKKD